MFATRKGNGYNGVGWKSVDEILMVFEERLCDLKEYLNKGKRRSVLDDIAEDLPWMISQQHCRLS